MSSPLSNPNEPFLLAGSSTGWVHLATFSFNALLIFYYRGHQSPLPFLPVGITDTFLRSPVWLPPQLNSSTFNSLAY